MNGSAKLIHFGSLAPGSNSEYIEELYQQFLQDPASVNESWRRLFDNLDSISDTPEVQEFDDEVELTPFDVPLHTESDSFAFKQSAVLRLINAYRVRGHQQADIDPINYMPRNPVPDLDPEYHRLTAEDMDTRFHTGSLFAPDYLPLREIINRVRKTYTGSIGAEYMHIVSTDKKRWIQQRLETNLSQPEFSPGKRIRIFERLTAAEGLEKYLHSRYVGQKRFSLEGGESLIPLLDEALQHSGSLGIEEIVLGMAHRGRLNVLTNIMGKSPSLLFQEFEGKKHNISGSGDVKYHMGFSSDINTPGGALHLALSFNPSHLEVINPVVIGAVKARQQRRNDHDHDQVMPVLIHGDAAFSGQGVIMETLNMSLARGFNTGGTLHIVINNQIGFTTSNPLDARSTAYCTDVAKMVEAPIFHVNGDDPEAVSFAINLAIDYRMRFKRDIVVDMICYRRHGHSEADEPFVTQPLMYSTIASQPTTRQKYADRLVNEGLLTAAQINEITESYRSRIHSEEIVARDILHDVTHPYSVDWHKYRHTSEIPRVDTTVEISRIQQLTNRLQQLPRGFTLHPRVTRIMEDRRKMAAGALRIDWGFAETMAYATLLEEGYWVRISGQDSGRGTFFHRHAILHDQQTGTPYLPLQSIPKQPHYFQAIDSLLSEEAVLGFELGFATAEPNALVIWEAQFGDFANGAQVIIDQFISSAETKWDRLTGLVMLLPHGFEGQGPEHSSARLERYLQLCAEGNMQVCVPSTPAQIFRLLRRQMLQPFRRPLIIMSPKSMLRNPMSTSSLEDLSQESFLKLIPEQDEHDTGSIRHIILCTGKVYYDLYTRRQEMELDDTVLIRIEQLYPFPRPMLTNALKPYRHAKVVTWCQEEPMNQGAWYQIRHHLEACLGKQHTLKYAGRDASAAPAVGSHDAHVAQQRLLVEQALLNRKAPVSHLRAQQ
jgi:2-oxoglutarate dehydrogenase E1 component